jgi:hypothetical protein
MHHLVTEEVTVVREYLEQLNKHQIKEVSGKILRFRYRPPTLVKHQAEVDVGTEATGIVKATLQLNDFNRQYLSIGDTILQLLPRYVNVRLQQVHVECKHDLTLDDYVDRYVQRRDSLTGEIETTNNSVWDTRWRTDQDWQADLQGDGGHEDTKGKGKPGVNRRGATSVFRH